MADDPSPGGTEQATIGFEEMPVGSEVVSNEAMLAELEAEQGKATAKAGKPVAKPVDSGDDDDEEGDEESDEPDAEPDEDDLADEEPEPDDDDDEGDDESDPAAAKDPETAKRMAAVARTERRNRERFERDRQTFEAERKAFDAERTTWESGRKRVESLSARVHVDPAGVLEELGATVDDMEYAAQQAYARSKSAATDPKYRAAADQAMRQRELERKAASAEERVAKIEQTMAERAKQAEQDRVLDAYFGRVAKRAGDETPRVKALIAKNPARARAELEVTAFELAQKLGRLPKSKTVLAAHEKKIARHLRDYGVEPDRAGDEKPADTTAAPSGRPAKPAPAKGKDAKAKSAPKPAPEDHSSNGEVKIPSREELMRELASGAHLS